MNKFLLPEEFHGTELTLEVLKLTKERVVFEFDGGAQPEEDDSENDFEYVNVNSGEMTIPAKMKVGAVVTFNAEGLVVKIVAQSTASSAKGSETPMSRMSNIM